MSDKRCPINPKNIEVHSVDGSTCLSIAPDGTITYTVLGAFPGGLPKVSPYELAARAVVTMQGCLIGAAESARTIERKIRARDFSVDEPKDVS